MRSIDYGDTVLPDRFWDKVIPEPMSGCWLWTASAYYGGYGQAWFDGEKMGAHKFGTRVILPNVSTPITLQERSEEEISP